MVAIDVDDYCASVVEDPFPSSHHDAPSNPSTDGILQGGTTHDGSDYEKGRAWGTVSRQDILCVLITLIILIAGIVVAFVLLFPADGDAAAPVNEVPMSFSNATNPTTQQQTYEALRQAMQAELSPDAALLSHFPADISALDDAYQATVEWLLSSSANMPHSSELLPRLVLGLTYFRNGGDAWTNRDHWLSSEQSVCTWYGIRCGAASDHSRITEVDLSDNGLVGPIHAAWTLLPNCTSILLHTNTLTGTIPGEVFGHMPALEYLYLKNNQLAGTVPTSRLSAGTLGKVVEVKERTMRPFVLHSHCIYIIVFTDTLFIQGNQITGDWPPEFCPTGEQPSISIYGMDCSTIECPCCDPSIHCFN